MRLPSRSKLAKLAGIGLALIAVALGCVYFWVIPAVIVQEIQSRLDGKVTIRGWWLNGTSAGVRGLTLHEGAALDSPVWLTVEKVGTDLTLGGLLRGRFTPGKVKVTAPRVTFRLDREGHFLNLPKVKGDGGVSGTLPSIETSQARITFRREDRPVDMVVSGVEATLAPDADGKTLKLVGEARDPYWGNWNSTGDIELSASTQGKIIFTGKRIITDPERMTRVVFIPKEAFEHVAPQGSVDLSVELDWETNPVPVLHTKTVVKLLESSAKFPSMDLETTQTQGTIRVDDGVLRLESARGQALGGQVEANGSLDFGKTPPQVALDLTMIGIDVVKTPPSWQLKEAEITGKLTGKVALRASLDPAGVDLSGSSGEAVVEGGTVQGIPVKSLKLAMHAEGSDLQFDAKNPGTSSDRRPSRDDSIASVSSAGPAITGAVQVIRTAFIAEAQDPPQQARPQPEPPQSQPQPEAKTDEPAPKASKPKFGGFHLPKSISTQIELEDVDVQQLIVKAQALVGLPLPIPITGKLSIKADATVPLGTIRDVKTYAFHGDLTLKGASIDKVDFGLLTARIDLTEGVLELKKLRGVLVDRPDGGPDNPPPPTQAAAIPTEGPLPSGGFRCDLRAEVAPLGKLTVAVEGNELPVGELAAPVLPRPTPASGKLTLQLSADTNLSTATDPASWSASGKAESVRLTYQATSLDRVSFDFGLKDSRLSVPRLEARLADKPLNGKAEIGLAAPYAYNGNLDVAGWDLAKLSGLLPALSVPTSVSGVLTVHAEAKGTMNPSVLETLGQGQVADFQVGAIPLSSVPFRWKTEDNAIVISDVSAKPFGGQITAEARVPISLDKPVEGSVTIAGVDTAKLTEAAPSLDLKLSGKADGRIGFVLQPQAKKLDADVKLNSPDLTVQGLSAEKLNVVVKVQENVVKYEVTADSLGGKVKFFGDFPLNFSQDGAAQIAPTGELRFVGFHLQPIWKLLGTAGAFDPLSGRGALNANIRQVFSGADKGLWARGIVEFRDLAWARKLGLGQLRGIVDISPSSVRVDPISGAVLGGAASGVAWGTYNPTEAPRGGFRVRIDRAVLRQLLAPWPELAQNATGIATIRLSGGLEKAFSASGDVQLTDARLAGVPVSNLHIPAELSYAPDASLGTVHIRQASVRLAGGQIRGEANFRIGRDRTFQGQVQLNGVDLQTLARINSDAAKASSGRINGRITLSGPDPTAPHRYRGKVDLDLDDASLLNIPVFREIDRFLGAAKGGLFEDGDLSGTIANGQLIVESLSLQGRLVQLHATGTVGFDQQLNLEVLINTNQIIPETGQALVSLIPGLRDTIGRRDQASLQVANYLSNRLLKLRVSGTVKNPTAALDSSVPVANAAVGFFSGVLKLPLGFVK
ncbi:AsmA-like C-terminal region-containing protein [Singulisphaera sp. PoT]|uniref:AsmA-like C-terminal region-containing protein n=1 Tax=Singulisphaera sp. PoT TaxID=3411797 RepID=UPI003BF4ABF2